MFIMFGEDEQILLLSECLVAGSDFSIVISLRDYVCTQILLLPHLPLLSMPATPRSSPTPTHTHPTLTPTSLHTNTHKKTNRGEGYKTQGVGCLLYYASNIKLLTMANRLILAQSVWRDSQCCEEWVKWISPCHIVGTDYCNWEAHLPFTQLCLFFTHACWKGTRSALVRADSDFFCFWVLMLEPRSGLRPLGLRNKRHRVKRRRRRGRRSKTVRNSEE